MRKTSGPYIGISFSEEAVHAVVANVGPSGPEVLQIASALLPHGVITDRAIVNPHAATAVLKQLLSDHKIVVRNAVLGLPSGALFARLITVPPVAGEERRTIIRGEIDHLNILTTGRGSFDYQVFERVDNGAGGKGEPIFFFAAEPGIIQDYRTMAEGAGLRVVAIEPSEYAAIRTVYPRLARTPLALAISFGTMHTDLFFYRDGRPLYARRLDLGIARMTVPELLDLSPPAPVSTPVAAPVKSGGESLEDVLPMSFMAGPASFADPTPEPEEPPVEERLSEADQARQMLMQDIGRSLDYFSREYRQDLGQLSTVLLPNHLELAGMSAYMTALLEQEVEFSHPFEHVRVPAALSLGLRQEEGVAYAPALGLALAPLGGAFAGVAPFDLGTEDAHVVRARKAPRQIAGAAGAAAGILALSGIAALYFAGRDAPVQQDLTAARAELEHVSQQEEALRTAQNQQLELVREIRAHNIPWTNVLRVLSQAVPGSVGLVSVTARGAALTIQGETRNPDAVALFWSRMQNSPFFAGAVIDSLVRVSGKTQFTMTATLPPPRAVSAAREPRSTLALLPISWQDLQDALKQAAGASVELTRLSAQGSLLTVHGRSHSEADVTRFWSALQRSPLFGPATVTRIVRQNGTIAFALTTTVAGGQTPKPDQGAAL